MGSIAWSIILLNKIAISLRACLHGCRQGAIAGRGSFGVFAYMEVGKGREHGAEALRESIFSFKYPQIFLKSLMNNLPHVFVTIEVLLNHWHELLNIQRFG